MRGKLLFIKIMKSWPNKNMKLAKIIFLPWIGEKPITKTVKNIYLNLRHKKLINLLMFLQINNKKTSFFTFKFC